MSSSNRNKLDEYHLKILRELLTHPANKYCFDCHQRGPTYVNVTIGSFVCTTCSGMLRGLTPPHRVKSITMATFTPEEIEVMKSRGNLYCKNVWLGLYDSDVPTTDEQQIKDFMIAKYEKKRYYVDPTLTTTHCAVNVVNGSRTPSSLSSNSSSSHNSPSSQNLSDCSSKSQNTLRTQQVKTNSVSMNNVTSSQLISGFGSPVSTASSSSVDLFGQSGLDSSSCSETSFANFDNNPAFEFNKCSGIATEKTSNFGANKTESNVPPEDKYAALKDLDYQMKSQMLEKQQEELKQQMNSNGDGGTASNEFNWNALFTNNHGFSSEPTTPFNPFKGEINAWKTSANGTVNPFSTNAKDPWNGNVNWPNPKIQSHFVPTNGWNLETIKPFEHSKGVWTQSNGQHQSNNPFL